MLKRLMIIISILFFLILLQNAAAVSMKPGKFLVLCYHAVPVRPSPDDSENISQSQFTEQIEYLKTHGYRPVSFDNILMAHEGKKELPEKPVLLTFDDAYISYYEFVLPILEKLGYPSVLAVVGKFIDNPPNGLSEPLMNWEQIKKVSSHKLVEVVSHTYDLHKAIQYNPHGNVGSAVSVRAFNPLTKNYETEDEYRTRIKADFISQNDLFKKQLGFTPRAVVWPYGRYNSINLEIAKEVGILAAFTIEEGFAHISNLSEVKRNLIKNTRIENFIKMVADPNWDRPMMRAVQVDLDLIYDANSYEQMEQNLGRLVDRLAVMKVNTVFLQAFADPEGTGYIKSVYFHNRVLPVRADIFSYAVHQMIIRDMTVYAWMPTLSIQLPDKEFNEKHKVRAVVEGKPKPSISWYKRLTPFSEDVVALVQMIYEDLASHFQVHGILFQDDAYLTDNEDFYPLAVEKYKERFGKDMLFEDLDNGSELAQSWARYKTEVLIEFTNALIKGVKRYRPNALFARNLYAGVLDNPKSELWFAQDFELFLKNYDQVVVMAYPQMERVDKPSGWLKKLVNRTREFPQAVEKTVFKVQAYDWRKQLWVKDWILLEELRDILSSGGRHIAYYPDNFWIDKPMLDKIRLEISTQTFPFLQ